MCTAITYKTKDHYFGRTLDLEYTYDEQVTVTPRNFELKFRTKVSIKSHHAIIGMATVADNYPLYYEAVNEYGLAMAGLNFPGNAHYFPVTDGKDNIAPFEFIPWILCQCKNLTEAREILSNINLCNLNFSEQLAAIQKDVKFTFENKVSKDSAETVVCSIKKLIEKILDVQSYVSLRPYKKETFGKAYLQEYLVGSIDHDFQTQFFESQVEKLFHIP